MKSTYKQLAQAAQIAHVKHDTALAKILAELKGVDPDIVDRAVLVWGDQSAAAAWFASASPPLGGKSPLQAMAESRRADVLALLAAIEHGLVL